METVRQAITRALEKGDARDRTFREKVYRQTFSALDRSLQSRSDLTPEAAEQQRQQVKAVIVEIERGFRQAAPAVETPEGPAPEAPSAVPEEAGSMPRIERDDRLDVPHDDVSQTADEVRAFDARPTRRRSYGFIVGMIALLGMIAIGVWIIYQTGMIGAAFNALSTTPEAIESGDGAPDQFAESEEDWITVFSPDEPTTATTPAGLSAQVVSGQDGAFFRVSGDGTDQPVAFDIGQGVLEQLAGKHAVFGLEARAVNGGETQISISCNLGTLGDCGRTRYVVGSQPTDYLFEVELPDGNPGSGGTIAIVPDVEGRGRALDIFSLRVRAE